MQKREARSISHQFQKIRLKYTKKVVGPENLKPLQK
jgi:hypothetical protein